MSQTPDLNTVGRRLCPVSFAGNCSPVSSAYGSFSSLWLMVPDGGFCISCRLWSCMSWMVNWNTFHIELQHSQSRNNPQKPTVCTKHLSTSWWSTKQRLVQVYAAFWDHIWSFNKWVQMLPPLYTFNLLYTHHSLRNTTMDMEHVIKKQQQKYTSVKL